MRKASRFTASMMCIASLAACGGGENQTVREPATQAPVGEVFTNPLELKPAPQFSTSGRAVVYDDCFPPYDDVKLGDVVKSTVETYSPATGIGVIEQTETVKSIVSGTFEGRSTLSVTTDNPPYVSSDNVRQYGVEATALILKGGTVTTLKRVYRTDETDTVSTTTNTPSAIGNLAASHIYTPFALRDSVEHKYLLTYDALDPAFDHQVNVTEKITFIGVEEGTEVAAGKFDYTCVFRQEISSTVNGQTITNVQDFYTNKFSGVKALLFNEGYPRPLVYQLVSNSALDRRKVR
ncbi:MAG TPA: hypothetical protein VJ654_21040 [Noviherbaspirillum sp.]|nr:hypothetical protein [Noviherbaspirillum sp.]